MVTYSVPLSSHRLFGVGVALNYFSNPDSLAFGF